jgi:hypothetical protein
MGLPAFLFRDAFQCRFDMLIPITYVTYLPHQ